MARRERERDRDRVRPRERDTRRDFDRDFDRPRDRDVDSPRDRDAVRERVGGRTEPLEGEEVYRPRVDTRTMERDRDMRTMPRRPYGGYRRPGVFTERRPAYLPRRDRRPGGEGMGLLLGLLILAALGVLLWWFLTQGDDQPVEEPTTGGTAAEEPIGAGAEPGVEGGTIATSDGQDVLGAAGTFGLSGFVNQTVRADGVEVLSVVGDEAFWAGSDAGRVLVVLSPSAESSAQIDVGDTVSFSGVVRPLPADPEGTFDIDEGEGMDILEQQGHYIEALTASEASASP
jgi:hypothetical protein